MLLCRKGVINLKKKIVGVLCAIIVLITVILVASVLFSDSDNNGTTNNIQESQSIDISDNEKLVHEDDFIKVWYVNSFEQPEIIADTCYFTLKVENKTDKQITLYPMDASANDNMINLLSGVPLTINPRKIGQNAFFFSYAAFANNMSEISTIEFKANLMDENTSSIHKADISFEF